MTVDYNTFVHLLFIGIIALFPVVNPPGQAVILAPCFRGLNKQEKKKAVKKIALYAFLICTISLFARHWILELFRLSIPVIQLSGGIMICKMGWEFLASGKGSDMEDTNSPGKNKTDKCLHRINYYWGSKSEIIVNRINAFLIFCIGLQIAINGIKSLVKG